MRNPRVIMPTGLVLLIACCVVFILSALTVTSQRVRMDEKGLAFMVGVSEAVPFLHVWEWVSFFGSKWGIISISLIVAVVLILAKRDYIGVVTLFVFVGGGDVINKAVKEWIARPRPVLHVEGYSFPSGHSMIGTIVYGLIIFFLFLHMKNQRVKIISAYGLVILLMLIGLSRLILIEHYLTDVIAGYSLGGILLLMAIACYNLTYAFLNPKPSSYPINQTTS
ncbi:phosphatase PAP2 family protein [Bacillus sp. CGMCC 1.16541]|uniref:phosphatase PAP2 family protein n=1 Tax=Bacillus sp. CGMCC 1.16541 TaxID=2185143 RepID=UPI000D737B26|nr:phosphatase PAP2 family protein [Bacillus sp. CGMCC 1.16541]